MQIDYLHWLKILSVSLGFVVVNFSSSVLSVASWRGILLLFYERHYFLLYKSLICGDFRAMFWNLNRRSSFCLLSVFQDRMVWEDDENRGWIRVFNRMLIYVQERYYSLSNLSLQSELYYDIYTFIVCL